MNYRRTLPTIGLIVAGLSFPVAAWAHVVVKPNQVGVGQFQTFTMGVPNEKDQPTTKLRLLIPDGLDNVSPNVKPGWTVEVKQSGSGDAAKVTELDWSGGSIPPEQRDDFAFSAQAPAKPTELDWKAYQTYADGSIVSWDQKPAAKEVDNDDAPVGPYSVTSVVNDLSPTPQPTSGATANQFSDILSAVAVIASLFALYFALRPRR